MATISEKCDGQLDDQGSEKDPGSDLEQAFRIVDLVRGGEAGADEAEQGPES